jgi:hypothetical protein
MDRVIREAACLPVPALNAGQLRATMKANVRRRRPATSAAIASVIPVGSEFEAAGFTASGEPVNGNACWYETPAHDYVWAGATDRPNPLQG